MRRAYLIRVFRHTIRDRGFVIHSGRVKEEKYEASRRMASLQDTLISRAATKQRRGRAGRVQPGLCVHLFPSDAALAPHAEPEVRRFVAYFCAWCFECAGRAIAISSTTTPPPPLPPPFTPRPTTLSSPLSYRRPPRYRCGGLPSSNSSCAPRRSSCPALLPKRSPACLSPPRAMRSTPL